MSWKNLKQTSLADALLIEHTALTELDGVHDLINWPTIAAELAYCFAVLSAYRWISATPPRDTLPMLRWGDEDSPYPYQSDTASHQPIHVRTQTRWHGAGDHALNQPTPLTCQTWQVWSYSP